MMRLATATTLLPLALVIFTACASTLAAFTMPTSAASLTAYPGAAKLSSYAASGAAALLSTGSEPCDGVVVIQGVFDPTGRKLLKIYPVHRYTYHSKTIPSQRHGRFMVRILYVTGRVTSVPFDALVADDAGRTRYGFFAVTVPIHGEIDSIRISDSSGKKTFAVILARQILA